MTCKDCRYWQRRHELIGQCRRRAPTVGALLWPETDPYDWCGEGEPIPRVEERRPPPIVPQPTS